jgi:hypothetical protein
MATIYLGPNKGDDPHNAFHEVFVLAGLRFLEGSKKVAQEGHQVGL